MAMELRANPASTVPLRVKRPAVFVTVAAAAVKLMLELIEVPRPILVLLLLRAEAPPVRVIAPPPMEKSLDVLVRLMLLSEATKRS
jgi:hypothetical protein